MTPVRATATLDLLATSAGGLRNPLPSGTRSLLLQFDTAAGEVTLGAVLETEGGSPISPGQTHHVRVAFWADESEAVVQRGGRFVVWYARTVGSGTVLAVS